MNNVTLTTTNLSFGYSDNLTLRELELSFEPGTFHAIVGPNGSGKSTLLDLLSGHRQPNNGQILLNGRPISSINAEELARLMALVPQETSFNFPFTVLDTVIMGCHPRIPRFSRPSKSDMDQVHAALKTMDLTRLSNRTIPELSGGERQRTVFARALAQATPCLLLDEPTSSMDIRHALAAMSHLGTLARTEKRTIIAVLHDLNLAAAHCDHITVLHEGQLFATGTPRDVLTTKTLSTVFGVTAKVHNEIEGQPLNITYESKDIS